MWLIFNFSNKRAQCCRVQALACLFVGEHCHCHCLVTLECRAFAVRKLHQLPILFRKCSLIKFTNMQRRASKWNNCIELCISSWCWSGLVLCFYIVWHIMSVSAPCRLWGVMRPWFDFRFSCYIYIVCFNCLFILYASPLILFSSLFLYLSPPLLIFFWE